MHATQTHQFSVNLISLENDLESEIESFLQSYPSLTDSFSLAPESFKIFYASRFNSQLLDETFESRLKKSVSQHIEQQLKSSYDEAHKLRDISTEEKHAIFEKLSSLTQQPSGVLDEETELYITQQISDILGINITSEIEGIHLPYTVLTIKADPYDKRTIHQKKKYKYPYAPSKNRRTFFGYTSSESDLTTEGQYAVALPLLILEHNTLLDELAWFSQKKIIVINSIRKKAVIASITDCTAQNTTEYQCLATPDVIREGEIWSPQSAGKVLMFFVDDPDHHVKPGILSLENKDHPLSSASANQIFPT